MNDVYVFEMFVDNGYVVRKATEFEIEIFREIKRDIPENDCSLLPIGTKEEVRSFAENYRKTVDEFAALFAQMDLDKIGYLYGLKRSFGETDEIFRQRLLKFRDINNVS
ncbi:hypothetical protein KAR91_03995 [Candidatus Pacearchaeota archaeon]|nr:hypothetical protein [Candidatus Pacearchaeota archaeon]